MMNKAHRILVVGSVNMDINLTAKKLPESGETILGDRYAYTPGGKGANQAAAAALLGADTYFSGRIGDDADGVKLRHNLERFGVNTEGLLTDAEAPSGLAAILVEADGGNRIMVYPGANHRLMPEDVLPLIERIAPEAIIVQFEIPIDTVLAVSEMAAERGIPFIVDAGPAQAFPIEKLAKPFIISPNESETLSLSGIYPEDDASAAKAASLLIARSGAKYAVIKCGSRGAYLSDGGSLNRAFSAISVHAVDSTAAGDAFTAALALKYLEGGDIEAAVAYANAVGALTVTKAGAQASLPTRQEVERFIAKAR
ncbi:MAG: ribokinase [Oscillospiraceae bacterium]|jgi:ribokinase|nr:ribokinase [Oscillospiraceae bacterium]